MYNNALVCVYVHYSLKINKQVQEKNTGLRSEEQAAGCGQQECCGIHCGCRGDGGEQLAYRIFCRESLVTIRQLLTTFTED